MLTNLKRIVLTRHLAQADRSKWWRSGPDQTLKVSTLESFVLLCLAMKKTIAIGVYVHEWYSLQRCKEFLNKWKLNWK